MTAIRAATDATVTATTKISVCGNGVKEGGEQCDGADRGGATCGTLGFSGGTLSCSIACDYETSGCPSGGGGGQPPKVCPGKIGDLNGDGRVDLIDFSILAYWWGRAVEPGACYDLNHDGKVTLADFSILAYHWTGP